MDRRVYGLISHHRLCLLAEDNYRSPWFVIIATLARGEYFIEYLMPAYLAPWSGAYVKGQAHSEDDAVQMIVTAMEKSEGWKGTDDSPNNQRTINVNVHCENN